MSEKVKAHVIMTVLKLGILMDSPAEFMVRRNPPLHFLYDSLLWLTGHQMYVCVSTSAVLLFILSFSGMDGVYLKTNSKE